MTVMTNIVYGRRPLKLFPNCHVSWDEELKVKYVSKEVAHEFSSSLQERPLLKF